MTAQRIMDDSSSCSIEHTGTTSSTDSHAGCLKLNDQSISATTPGTTSRQVRRRVRFGTLDVYEFPRILGDHPGVSCGAPLALAPCHCHHVQMDVSAFECCRKPRRVHLKDLLLSPQAREEYLLSQGYSLQEICEAADQALKIRLKREKQFKTHPLMPFGHDTVRGLWDITKKSLIRFPKKKRGSVASLLRRHSEAFHAA